MSQNEIANPEADHLNCLMTELTRVSGRRIRFKLEAESKVAFKETLSERWPVANEMQRDGNTSNKL